jgi:hypothetical protein
MSSHSLMHRVFPPSEPPDGGHPQSFRLVVGGTQLRGSWYLSAIVRLQGFSSCSPAAPLRRAVTQDGDLQIDGGGKQAGLRPLPLPQPQRFSSSVLGRGVCRVGVGPCVGGGPLFPSVIGGKGVRCSWRWQMLRAWLSDPSGFGAAPGAAFRHGSCKRFFRRRDSRGRPRTDLQLYGLLPVLTSRVWARGEGLMAAASALRSSLLLFGPRGRSCRRRRCWSRQRRAVRWSSVAPQPPPQSSGVVRTYGGGNGVPFVMAP